MSSYKFLPEEALQASLGGSSDRGFVRVPARGALEVIILSEKAVGYRGHYSQNGCEPCQGERCAYCARGVGTRLRACYSVSQVDLGGRWLLDVGEGTFAQITAIGREVGSLRGVRLRLTKRGGLVNGQIDAVWWNRLVYPSGEIMEAQVVEKALEEMWELRRVRGQSLLPSVVSSRV